MPYISQEKREDLGQLVNMIQEGFIQDAGELNYLITTLIHQYLYHQEQRTGKPSYVFYNDVVGALECAKMELYRRKVIPYENEKIKQNGDVS